MKSIYFYSDHELCSKDAHHIQNISQAVMLVVMFIFNIQYPISSVCLIGTLYLHCRNNVNTEINIGYMSFQTTAIPSLSQSVKSHHCLMSVTDCLGWSPVLWIAFTFKWNRSRETYREVNRKQSCSRTQLQHTPVSVAGIKSVTVSFCYGPVFTLQ